MEGDTEPKQLNQAFGQCPVGFHCGTEADWPHRQFGRVGQHARDAKLQLGRAVGSDKGTELLTPFGGGYKADSTHSKPPLN